MSKIVNEHATPEQHPDGEAVDRFAVAMKAKLAKSREKGRHGWQMGSAAYLSSLLYRHMYKGDPLDVANLAMMLHQNGQAIELPQEARRDQGFNKSSEVQRLREAGDKLYNELRQWLATEHDPECQAALREWRAALAAHDKQSGEKKS